MRFLVGVLILVTLFVLLTRRYTVAAQPMTAASACGMEQDTAPTTAATGVTLQLWALAAGRECWRAYGPVLAARQLKGQAILVQSTAFETRGSIHRQAVDQAVQKGHGPDLASVSLGALHRWAASGAIVPLDRCRARYPTFTTIDNRFWSLERWHDQIWGVPLEANLLVLYFNKELLHALGWFDAQIEALPTQIRTDAFPFDALLATARQAVAEGIIEPGYAIWPAENSFEFFQLLYTNGGSRLYDETQDRLVISQAALTKSLAAMQQLLDDELMATTFLDAGIDSWLNNNLRRDALAAGRVLFWVDHTTDWAEWATNYMTDHGGAATLAHRVGMAPFPAFAPQEPGRTLLVDAAYYAILAKPERAPARLDAACAVLAESLTPAINDRHVNQAHYLSVLSPTTTLPPVDPTAPRVQLDALRDDAQISYWLYPALWDWFTDDAAYQAILLDALADVGTRRSEPTVAADRAIRRLQSLLGDQLLVE